MQTITKALKQVASRFYHEGYTGQAASLAYSTLLTIVPVMMVGFYALSFFPNFKGAGELIQHFVFNNFVAGSATVITEHLSVFLQQLSKLTPVNIISLCLVSMLMIYNMVHAFNRVWQVKMERHLALSFLIYLLILLVTPVLFGVLMVVSASLGTMLGALPLLSEVKKNLWMQTAIIRLLPYVTAFITFTFFNWMLPSCKVKLTHAMIAGLVTTILFESAKSLFVFYLKYFPTYKLLYGALATIPIFLVWLYVTWLIILLGGLLCHALSEKRVLSI